ncbi:helicase C-terminal domain-containing protein [Microvirga sp. CF3016]|uniref:helicase C-terminal domain-containing protein n=1 Tax=Microvirga sp. CF3016 TaxID=3110181 RepID=UPI002E77436F|nr:helicase C-terminal domain-containing protein [Microvirga sp. CF3016]MEE1611864.1 helicase C-terminal domain-containing protein [Microvirga sp. CF3016]
MTRDFLPLSSDGRYAAGQRFVEWLMAEVLGKACRDASNTSQSKPSDRFWLGRLAPSRIAAVSGRDNRLDRLEPCEIGFRFQPSGPPPWNLDLEAEFCLWQKGRDKTWRKIEPVSFRETFQIDGKKSLVQLAKDRFDEALQGLTNEIGLHCELRVTTEHTVEGKPILSVTLVNSSDPDDTGDVDPRFYEACLRLHGFSGDPFSLEALEDAFRYDRTVAAYGINCGVVLEGGALCTEDAPTVQKMRPNYWGAPGGPPDMSFASLAQDPVAPAQALADAHRDWGTGAWSQERLEARGRSEQWTPEMQHAAKRGADQFWEEQERIRSGVRCLREDPHLNHAFRMMSEAMSIIGSRRGYNRWRPFQFGFLLANIGCIANPSEEANIADIVWFATGGGKTETYLGLLITAAFYDRLRGKAAGITAWSRFPLRLLSLQQMQRFADAMAAAELVRRRENIVGYPFSIGFLVGDGATPNRIRRPEQDRNSKYDPDDPTLGNRFRMLKSCPFCGSERIKVRFDTASWTLQHRCSNDSCGWPERGLPFHIVDEEVFRFLPTIVVGTLDKAASIGMQQAMRGLVGAPRGLCSCPNHGFTYNPNSSARAGCLVPECTGEPKSLPFPGEYFPPSFRLQDELHLLRDSLGAVDGHYEAVLDGLQEELTGKRAKILASSATLSGYEKQCRVLYRRAARVFPQPGPSPQEGFWSTPSSHAMRRFVALAPRGATIEFAVDRLVAELQIAIRRLTANPGSLCEEIGIDPGYADFLLSQYGTTTVYGSTLRDLDAVSRSSTTQLVGVEGPVNSVSLTGRTQFDEVARTLDSLEKLDEGKPFEERIHLITASSMMSHGVDVDRLNVMIVLGLPLTTAEFIQATARVGRKWPALVLVVHKMGRERDAGVFRSFPKFVEQGDRFVEPIPITSRSRRVLERTIPGLEMARLLHVHAPTFEGRFTTVKAVQHSLEVGEVEVQAEIDALIRYLEFDPASESEHIEDISDALDRYFGRLGSPSMRPIDWFGAVWSPKPMNSLRDVEEQVTVHLKRDA